MSGNRSNANEAWGLDADWQNPIEIGPARIGFGMAVVAKADSGVSQVGLLNEPEIWWPGNSDPSWLIK